MPRIYNKGKRKITFGRGADEAISPEKFLNVSDEVMVRLKRMYPNDIVDMGDMSDLQSQFKEKEEPKKKVETLTREEAEKEKAEAIREALRLERAGREQIERATKAGEDKKALDAKKAADKEKAETAKKAPPLPAEEPVDFSKMDRAEIVEFVEKNELSIKPDTFQNIDVLRKAVDKSYKDKLAASQK